MRRIAIGRAWRRAGALIVLTFSTPSWAQSPAPADVAGNPTFIDAKKHFDSGVKLMYLRAWDSALAEFLAARKLSGWRAPTRNAAVCLRQLHRFEESMAMFEALLREFPDLDAPTKHDAEKQLAELEALVGTIDIHAEPGSAAVIDGADRGTVPLPAPLRVSAGTHVVRLVKEGYEPFETKIEVAGRDHATVDAKQRALAEAGRLKVVEESGAALDVLVDFATVGTTPWDGVLSVGDHVVALRGKDGVGTQPVAAPVQQGTTTVLTLKAEPLPVSLRVEPIPGGSTIAIDGVTVGRGVWKGNLRIGNHRVEAAADGFVTASRTVVAPEPAELSLKIELERDPSSALWRAQNPPRIFAALSGAPTLTAIYGGAIADGCTGGCSSSVAVGAFAMAQVGYQLPVGLALSIDAGYLSLRRNVAHRTAAARPGVNESPIDGVADDLLLLRGALLGASAAFRRRARLTWQVALGIGGYLAASATDRISFHGPNLDFEVFRRAPATYVYVSPSASVGLRLGEHVEINAGARVLLLFAVSQPAADAHDIQLEDGRLAVVDSQALAGKTMLLVAPGVGARYEF